VWITGGAGALSEYGWDREPHRVHLAILKLSVGSMEKLRENVRIASTDYRDVLAPAEYPRFWQVGFVGVNRMTEAEVEAMKAADWRDYRAWLDLEMVRDQDAGAGVADAGDSAGAGSTR
jgi:hypothetical protein